MSPPAIAVDLGGTHVRAALVRGRGEVAGFVKALLTDRAPAAVASQIAELVRELPGAPSDGAITIGVAGSVYTARGVVGVAPNLEWRDVPLGDLVARASGRAVRLVNDLNAITYGETYAGAGRGLADVACLFVGTGVGLGAVVQGTLLEGADGLAPELGHVKVASAEHGRLCGCGQRGCLEAYTSGRHLPELLRDKAAQGLASPLLAARGARWTEISAGDIDAAAGQGDAAALALWSDVAEHLAWAMGLVVMLLNPKMIVTGGGVLASAPRLAARVMERAKAHAWPSFTADLAVVPTALGDAAGLVGCGLLAQRRP